MTRRRAASFIELALPNGQRVLIESPNEPMLDAVLAAIGIRHRKPASPSPGALSALELERQRLVEQHNVGNPL